MLLSLKIMTNLGSSECTAVYDHANPAGADRVDSDGSDSAESSRAGRAKSDGLDRADSDGPDRAESDRAGRAKSHCAWTLPIRIC